MGANARTKGQGGEREIAKHLNAIVHKIRSDKGLSGVAKEDEPFQRNQNQTAVGGSDLSNPFYLEIEVKRQEQLSINTWWKQCVEQAERGGGIPILIFRQNRKKWRVCMFADIPLQPAGVQRYRVLSKQRVEVPLETFIAWFAAYYADWVDTNELS